MKSRENVDFLLMCADMTEKPTILYEIDTQQGWLVPEITAILHMMHVRARHLQSLNIELKTRVPFAVANGTHSNIGGAAFQAIVNGREAELYSENDKPVRISHWVHQLWSNFDQIRNEMITKPLSRRSGLVGWDFRSIAVSTKTTE